MISGASAKRSARVGADDDLVPLHSIVVRQDVDMRETRNWDELACVEDQLAGCGQDPTS